MQRGNEEVATGSLQKSKGKWYVVTRIPDEAGVIRQKWINTGVSAKGNHKKEAMQRKNEIIAELTKNKIVYSAEILFTDWVDKWLQQKEKNKSKKIAQVTMEGYRLIFKTHIEPYFSRQRTTLQGITPQQIQDYYDEKEDEGYSAHTIQKHHTIIKGALKEAWKKDIIPTIPADKCDLPQKEKFVGGFYNQTQVDELLDAIGDDPLKPAIMLGCYYGLRRSEIAGLRWQDIDFELGTISIRNTVVRHTKELIEREETKTIKSRRTLAILPSTEGFFLNLKRQQAANRLLIGSKYIDSNKVCVHNNGEPFKPSYISQHFALLLTKYGLPKIRFHDLRHTAASLLIKSGLPYKQIQEMMGHELITTTMDTYGHVDMEIIRETAMAMDKLVNKRAI